MDRTQRRRLYRRTRRMYVAYCLTLRELGARVSLDAARRDMAELRREHYRPAVAERRSDGPERVVEIAMKTGTPA